jgi:hypothetical protein
LIVGLTFNLHENFMTLPLRYVFEAVGSLVDGLMSIVKLHRLQQEAALRSLRVSDRIVDTTLNMVIIRLGDIQLHTSDDGFLREAARLDNCKEWMPAEREFRLCRSLRHMETFPGRLALSIANMIAWPWPIWNTFASDGQVTPLAHRFIRRTARFFFHGISVVWHSNYAIGIHGALLSPSQHRNTRRCDPGPPKPPSKLDCRQGNCSPIPRAHCSLLLSSKVTPPSVIGVLFLKHQHR